MKRHFVTALIFIAAITFYFIGAVVPGTAFLVVGGLTELIFWWRVISSGKPNSIR